MVFLKAATLVEAVRAGTLAEVLGGADSVVFGGGGVEGPPEEALLQLYLSGIRSVDHRWNGLGDAGLLPLLSALQQEECMLEEVQLCSNSLTSRSGERIAAILPRCRRLRGLQLYGNSMGAEGAAALGAALAGQPTAVTLLSLGLNNIRDSGTVALAQSLAENSSLTSISLSRNAVGDEGALALAALLARHPALTSLSLQANAISVEGGRGLGAALAANCSLTELDLSENELLDAGVQGLAEGLFENAGLRTLLLSKTACGDDGVLALGDALVENECLAHLDISGNHVQDLEGVLGLFSYPHHITVLNLDDQAPRQERRMVFRRRPLSTSVRVASSGSDSDSDSNGGESDSWETDDEESDDENLMESDGEAEAEHCSVSDSVSGSDFVTESAEEEGEVGGDNEEIRGRYGGDEERSHKLEEAEDPEDGCMVAALPGSRPLDGEGESGGMGGYAELTGDENAEDCMERDSGGEEELSATSDCPSESCGAAESSHGEEQEDSAQYFSSPPTSSEGEIVDEEAAYQEALRRYAEEDRRLREAEAAAPLLAEREFHLSILADGDGEEEEDLQDRWQGLFAAIRFSREEAAQLEAATAAQVCDEPSEPPGAPDELLRSSDDG